MVTANSANGHTVENSAVCSHNSRQFAFIRGFFLLICVTLAAALFMAACDTGGGDVNADAANYGPVKRVTVSPGEASVVKGQTAQFTAVVEGKDAAAPPNQAVTWSIDEDGLKEGTAISAEGILTVAAGETATVLTVRAVSVQDGEKNGGAAVAVLDQPAVSLVTVEPSLTAVAQGFTRQFAAVVAAAGAAEKTVTWSVSGNAKAATVINSSTGLLVIAPDEPIGGTLTVTATSTFNSEVKGTAQVTIAVNVPLAELAGTVWCWGDRPQGGITVSNFVIGSPQPGVQPQDGVQYGMCKCYRPFDPDRQIYDDWFYYNPLTKTGEIEYIGKFYIPPDNGKLVMPQYASYPHGAEFARVLEAE
jgi:uncharacterized protein YjdB